MNGFVQESDRIKTADKKSAPPAQSAAVFDKAYIF